MALNRKIAVIELDRHHVDIFSISEALRRKYLGGRGMGAYLFCRHAARNKAARGAEATGVISAGLLGGTLSAPMAYATVTTASPADGLLERTHLHGPFGDSLRHAGFDHLVIRGRAKRPVVLIADNGALDLVKPPHRGSAVGDIRISGDRLGRVFMEKNLMAVACRGCQDIEVKAPEAIIDYERGWIGSAAVDPMSAADVSPAVRGPAGCVDTREILETVAQCLGLPFGNKTGPDMSVFVSAPVRLRYNTGMALDEKRLRRIAYRCIALDRLYNIRQGAARKGGPQASDYRKNGWTRAAVMKKTKVFDALEIDDLWDKFK
jgi:aldehyde:ferredoxin oxidoreductase